MIYLVEFKTEINSLTYDQFKTYIEACQLGWHSLIYYYFNKAISNSNWRKFVYGLYYIHNIAPGILGLSDPLKFEEFIQKSRGVGINEYLEMLKGQIRFETTPEVKFIFFLAPSSSDGLLKSFVGLNSNMENYYEELITLFDFAESVDDQLKQLLRSI